MRACNPSLTLSQNVPAANTPWRAFSGPCDTILCCATLQEALSDLHALYGRHKPGGAVGRKLAFYVVALGQMGRGDWLSLGEEIKQLLGSNDVRQVHAGCLAALESIRAFRCVTLMNFFCLFLGS